MNYLSHPLSLLTVLGFIGIAQAGTAGPIAETPVRFYINAGVGGIFANTNTSFTTNSTSVLYSPTAIGTSLFSLPDINWQNKFKNGYSFNAALGQYFNPNWRGDVEFLYQNIERDSFGSYGWREQNSVTGAVYAQQANNPISNITARANIYSFLTNIAYDFNGMGKWQPIIGAGIGVAWLNSGSIQTNNTLNIDDPNTPVVETASAIQNSPSLYGTAFAWQFKAGISYKVSDMATAIFLYRLYGTTQFKGSESNIVSNPGVAGQSIFFAGQHDIKGLLINAVELNMRFNV